MERISECVMVQTPHKWVKIIPKSNITVIKKGKISTHQAILIMWHCTILREKVAFDAQIGNLG